jgi:diguanylate cyclase (GGDEF)-like protein/PAS domain S-box-containing protein
MMLLVSATAGIVVLVAFILATFNDVKSSSEMAKESLTTLADVVANNIASAIIFDDLGAASETLNALHAENSVLVVDVLDMQGNIFSSYRNQEHNTAYWLHDISFINKLTIERPIVQNMQQVGTIRILADLDSVYKVVSIRFVTNFFGLVIAFLIGYIFLRKMLRHLFTPIDKLTHAMGEIVDNGHYSLRVEKTSMDELGQLTDGFNLMLSQIEYRDIKLRQSDQALSQIQEAIALCDEKQCYQYANSAFIVLFGYQLEELIERSISLEPKLIKDRLGPTQQEIFEIAREHGSYRGESRLQTKSGKLLPISIHVSPIKDDDRVTGYITVFSDISEKKQAEEQIWKQANFDLVTGLPNRNMFYEQLEREVQVSKRTDTSFALMFLDLDNFKEVNDSLGHDVGDLLLMEVANTLTDCLRSTDTIGRDCSVARLGGDEFTIILSHFKDIKMIDAVVQRILTKIGMPFQLGNDVVNVSASIGITLCPEDAADAESLIRNADQSMYSAKDKGKNTFSYFTKSMQEAAAKRRKMTNDLRIAIEKQQFLIQYQPIVDLATNKILKAEALLRWEHPSLGIISPAEFIPVAEDTGLIVDIGNWVFFKVADQLVEWRQTIDKNFQVSINKSPVQFYNKGKDHELWFDYLNKLELPGSSLVVEITEGLMLDGNKEVSNKLLAFRDEGIQVAVDDFGTGYSSLSYLKKFDVDYIKIDKSFVQNLSIHSEDLVLCEAIIVMAHKLGLKVIAEGVETFEQRDLLFAVGCDYGQGYLFSKPVSVDSLEQLCIMQNKLGHGDKAAYELIKAKV